jgi:hypothetical protein
MRGGVGWRPFYRFLEKLVVGLLDRSTIPVSPVG